MGLKEDFIKKDGHSFPGKVYVEALLKPVFNDQKTYLFDAMFALHRAHVVMLAEQNLLPKEEAREILSGLNELGQMNRAEIEYDPNYEDLFFMIESKLGVLIGDELAGKVHLARSRNDMGEGMYRYVLREKLLHLVEGVDRLSEALIEQSALHMHSIMPAHTHTQPAQPTTFGHYLLAIYDSLRRDRARLLQAFQTVNMSPLGAAAITTTGFAISRERLAALLGFDEVLENSYDAIGTGDYLVDAAQSVISLMINTGRWVQEFLRFASHEVGLIKVADAYVQTSSIMPQKRNPVSIEHSRSLASNAIGKAQTVIQMLHNTPYGDINDSEDDLQPILYDSLQTAGRVMQLMNAVIRTMDFNVVRAKKQAGENLIVITELADVLTRDHGMSFRKSHTIATKIAQKSVEEEKELFEWTVEDINQFIGDVKLMSKEWADIVNPSVFVERRKIRGGPSPVEVKRMIEKRLQYATKEANAFAMIQGRLQEAEKLLELSMVMR